MVVPCGTARGGRPPEGAGRGVASAPTGCRRHSSTKLGPGSAPGGNRGRVTVADSTAPASLASLLDVVADELLGVVLEHLVDLVEEVVDLGLQPFAALGRGGHLFFGDRLLPLRGASFLLTFSHLSFSYEPSRRSSSAGLSHPSNKVSTCFAVPLSGSIIGTRRSGS